MVAVEVAGGDAQGLVEELDDEDTSPTSSIASTRHFLHHILETDDKPVELVRDELKEMSLAEQPATGAIYDVAVWTPPPFEWSPGPPPGFARPQPMCLMQNAEAMFGVPSVGYMVSPPPGFEPVNTTWIRPPWASQWSTVVSPPPSPRAVFFAPPSVSPPKPLMQCYFDQPEIYSRKVFIGGLPFDVNGDVVKANFARYGNVWVDWPRRVVHGSGANREMSPSSRFMTGYVFLVFEEEMAVQRLLHDCHFEDDRYFLFVSSPTMRNKPVQVRPWKLTDVDHKPEPAQPLDSRRTVFIGGVPRPTRASEIAHVVAAEFGGVCYVGIDIDPELKYPKGAARVTFDNTASYVAALKGRFAIVPHADSTKRVEIKPYVMEEQLCDECNGERCDKRYASYFCGDPICLQYYCECCWDLRHYGPMAASPRSLHKPLIRSGDQTKQLMDVPHHRVPTRQSKRRH